MLGWCNALNARTSRSDVRRTSSTSGSFSFILNSFTAQVWFVFKSTQRITRPYAPSPTSSSTRNDPPLSKLPRSTCLEGSEASSCSSSNSLPSSHLLSKLASSRFRVNAPSRRSISSSSRNSASSSWNGSGCSAFKRLSVDDAPRDSRSARATHARIASTAGSSSRSPSRVALCSAETEGRNPRTDALRVCLNETRARAFRKLSSASVTSSTNRDSLCRSRPTAMASVIAVSRRHTSSVSEVDVAAVFSERETAHASAFVAASLRRPPPSRDVGLSRATCLGRDEAPAVWDNAPAACCLVVASKTRVAKPSPDTGTDHGFAGKWFSFSRVLLFLVCCRGTKSAPNFPRETRGLCAPLVPELGRMYPVARVAVW
mmetsp:Transcript_6930/g.23325  ORF Transcript_6930/g.23325 Transcript_6930/m.23325 type:complete len:373 (-) Transcript_6930:635-1753(-)